MRTQINSTFGYFIISFIAICGGLVYLGYVSHERKKNEPAPFNPDLTCVVIDYPILNISPGHIIMLNNDGQPLSCN